MKVSLKFLSVLVLILVALYVQPILFPEKNPAQPISKKNSVAKLDSQAGQYTKVKTSGFAQYVTGNTSALEKAYGKPKAIYPTAFGTYWWVYGADAQNYFVAEVQDKQVIALTVLGEKLDVAPFKLNMSLRQISQLVPLATNFSFTTEGQQVQLELSEEDLNFRPLVAFANDTFAILQMSQGSGKLEAIRYVRQADLATLHAYQTDEASIETERTIKTTSDWEAVNQANQKIVTDMIKQIRAKEHRKTTAIRATIGTSLQTKLNQIQTVPSTFFANTERLDLWQQYLAQQSISVKPFTLISAESKKLYPIVDDPTEPTTYLSVTHYDPTWTVLSWIGNLYYADLFTSKSKEEIGVVAAKNLVLVSSLQPEQEVTKTTTSKGGK